MVKHIPSGAEIRASLLALSYSQVRELSKLSGVPFNTLWNVRKGEEGGGTTNPGIETVRKFLPFVASARQAA